jgi:hypothetical protein
MPLSPTRKRLNTLFGLLILGAMGYIVWPFVVGADHMQTFCSELSPGQSYDQVKAQVSKRGYRISLLTEEGAFVYDDRSMARFNCNLRFSGSGLESAEYYLND